MLGMSEPMGLKELIQNSTDFDEFEIYLQYLGYNDANNRELYEGDVIELTITEDLMNPEKNMFFNSNLGKYIKEHPNITHIVLEHEIELNALSMPYSIYAKYNGKFQYLENGIVKCLSRGEESNFPKYLVEKGAVYIGNVVENPYLIKPKPLLKQNDMIRFCRPFGYKGTVDIDGDAAVMKVENGVATVQFIRNTLMGANDIGEIREISINEILKYAKMDLAPLTLKEFLWCNRFSKICKSVQEAVEYYCANYDISDEDFECIAETVKPQEK